MLIQAEEEGEEKFEFLLLLTPVTLSCGDETSTSLRLRQNNEELV